MKFGINQLPKILTATIFVLHLNTYSQDEQSVFEEVIVTAEKRDESLQDVSQAVTAITDTEIEAKNITSFVDLTAIVPGVTVAKNEGYKTVISIRGVGNETNQNAIAAPSVAYHMDGIFIASPFSLQTDFLDVERIEVLRGPQGTLFGQNSTGGAINVISKKPSTDSLSSKAQVTLGDYGLMKVSSSTNFPISDTLATRFSFSSVERDGFSENIQLGQELDDANSISLRSDWIMELSDTSSLRFFAQYFDSDRNGAAMKGIDDYLAPDPRELNQDTMSKQELSSKIFALTYESDLGFANLKVMASVQEDDILVVRDNDRHSFGRQLVLSIPGFAGVTYPQAEFNPETSLVDTTTFEVNLISNEPLMDGKLDWTVGAFFMEHEIENHIRGYVDETGADDNNGELIYDCRESFANPNYCYDVNGPDPWFFFEFDFVTDAFPTRESFSVYAQTTYSFSDELRLISGLRYIDDEAESCVKNFFTTVCDNLSSSSDETTGKIAVEYDFNGSTMGYASYTIGSKPGGTNLTYGFSTREELDGDFRFGSPVVPPMVYRAFESENLESLEFGLKSDFLNGKARANIAVFSYDYENLQFQATDPDPYRGGVANIPNSEMDGVEIEFTALLGDSITFDMNLGFIDTEVTSEYEVLDNVLAYQYFFTEELERYNLREDVKGNMLAKTPEFTADATLTYEGELASGNPINVILQFIRRGEFMQRVSNNPFVDTVPEYQIFNLTVGIDFPNNMGLDFLLLNATDENGVNSSMTDVFGVAATGIELIPPRQVMTRLSYNF
ncbi:TonB-dependent receptor [Gammaproteobacteria bacterium]|nr:TonB-dependent receptor [Gammaproteobacteria bacterium]